MQEFVSYTDFPRKHAFRLQSLCSLYLIKVPKEKGKSTSMCRESNSIFKIQPALTVIFWEHTAARTKAGKQWSKTWHLPSRTLSSRERKYCVKQEEYNIATGDRIHWRPCSSEVLVLDSRKNDICHYFNKNTYFSWIWRLRSLSPSHWWFSVWQGHSS